MAPMENGRKKTGRGGCWRMNSWGFPLLLLPDVHPCRAPALSLPFSTGAPRCPAWGWPRLPGGFHLEGGGTAGCTALGMLAASPPPSPRRHPRYTLLAPPPRSRDCPVGVQAQAPCPGGTGTICNFVSEENDIHLEFGDGLARWAFLKGHFTNKH